MSVRNIMVKRYLLDDTSYIDEDDITQIFYEVVLNVLLKEDIELICNRFNQLVNTGMSRKIEAIIETYNKDKDLCELYACIKYEKYDHKSIEDLIIENSLHDEILKALNSNKYINERDKKIIIDFFGINDGKEKTLRILSKKYGLSRDRIRQIIEKNLRRLRHPKTSRMLIDYLDL